MKQATRSLLTLGVVGLIGGAVALVAWQQSGEEAATVGPADKKLYKRLIDDVTSFEIVLEGNLARVEKQAEGWTITKPVVIGADEKHVTRLLRAVDQMRVQTEFNTPERPEVPPDELTGLAAPSAMLTLFAGQEQWKIERGAVSEFNRESYFRSTDGTTQRIGTISPSAASALKRTWQSFRDKRVVGAAMARVLSLRVEPAKPAPDDILYEVRRRPPDPNVPAYRQQARFEAVAPPVGEADTMRINSAFKSLSRAPLVELLTLDHKGDLAAHGLDKPAWVVRLTIAPYTAEGEPFERTVRISAPEADSVLVARDDQPWVGKCAATLVKDLPLSEDALKSKKLFGFDRGRVSRVEMNLTEAGHIVVERVKEGDNQWRMLAPVPARAKAHVVTSIVLAFSELVGEQREAEGAAAKKTSVLRRTGLLEPQKMTFFDDGGAKLGTLLIGKRLEKQAFAMAEGGTYIVRVPASRLDVLPLKAEEIVDTR